MGSKDVLKIFLINAIAIAVILLMAEGLLTAFGYPADVPFKTAHRPHIDKTYNNIEFEYDFFTNSMGLRYPEITKNKPPAVTRILLLGDSFTEGVGVEAQATFGMLLENHFSEQRDNAVQFVNGGLGGEGPLRFWRVFHQIGLTLQPDGILVFIYANDVMDTHEGLTREDLYHFAPKYQGFEACIHDLIPRIHNLIVEVSRLWAREQQQSSGFIDNVAAIAQQRGVEESEIIAWQKRLPATLIEATDAGTFNGSLLSMGLFNPGYWDEAFNLTSTSARNRYRSMQIILDEIAEISKQQGIALGVVYVPAPLQYDLSRQADWNPWVIGGVETQAAWVEETSELQARLASWAQAREVPFFDLAPPLRASVASGTELNIKLDGHWNRQGHRVVANALSQWLEDIAFPPMTDTTVN
ncbi:MAG: hypothetical protein HRT77_05215 [Halioglobus sp.]|nr:hypothetical protein [Halioglobus sp.]